MPEGTAKKGQFKEGGVRDLHQECAPTVLW